ncbi:MAG: hypothetical protein HN348_30900 [Proteobacteria bacterium]|nr:hypothetical protein [Pseudomonadota bacterium]
MVKAWLVLLFSLFLVPSAFGDDLEGRFVERTVEAPVGQVVTDPQQLGLAARHLLKFLDEHGSDVPQGHVAGLELEETIATLRFIERTAREDKGKSQSRLADPEFIADHFRFIRWNSDESSAEKHNVKLQNGRIRLTRYLVYRQQGSTVRTESHPFALYAAPDDEEGLSNSEAEKRRDSLLRFRFTRSDVFGGVYEAGGAVEGRATPLVWLSRQGVYDALMQGTIQVDLEAGSSRVFNVHKCNDIAYDRSLRQENQGRYWYFRQTNGFWGWGDGRRKVEVVPQVTVAGDIENIGLGKVFLLDGGDGRWRLAILADTGGAFHSNLYQLDYFAGVFRTKAEFNAATAGIPDRVHADILVVSDRTIGSEGH